MTEHKCDCGYEWKAASKSSTCMVCGQLNETGEQENDTA